MSEHEKTTPATTPLELAMLTAKLGIARQINVGVDNMRYQAKRREEFMETPPCLWDEELVKEALDLLKECEKQLAAGGTGDGQDT